MSPYTLADGQSLLVASRGGCELHGLTRWVMREGQWHGRTLASVAHLSSLARHPTLPVVYGTSGAGFDGMIHAWRIEDDTATTLGAKKSGGDEPCHLAVDPTGRLVVVTNYSASALAIQRLGPDGSFSGEVAVLPLAGSGPETERQEAAHPHHAVFADSKLFVIDLGADVVREFSVDLSRLGADCLVAGPVTVVPPNTGPRHAVMLDDGRLAVSGELSSALIVGTSGDPNWTSVASTRHPRPGKTRWSRNYPGDIQRSIDGRHVYLANRSLDTVATFDVSAEAPILVGEIDTQTQWPQHLLVTPTHLLVAGWDSSTVEAATLHDGVPGEVSHLFDCPGAVWLMLWN